MRLIHKAIALLKIYQKQKCEFGLNSAIVSKGDLNPQRGSLSTLGGEFGHLRPFFCQLIRLFPDPTTKLFSGSLYRIPIICNYIQIKPCRDDPLLVKSGTKVSIKYLPCLIARPSVSRESVHYPKLRFISPEGEVRTQRCWRW